MQLNNRAKQLALENATHGTAVIAMQQTAGQGRLGRSFFSHRAKVIYLSIIIKPSFALSTAVLVTAAAAVAVAQAIENVCGKQARIKWVNDVYLDGKKICGTLTEGISDFETGHIESLVIGIGVNTSVKDFPDELRDTVGAVDGDYSKAQLSRPK
ncbi:MAG: biotin--[acetyl-CoA-carboxylase] ligase [Clostridia bacterium]